MAQLSAADDSDRSLLLWTALQSTLVLGLVGSVFLWLSVDYLLTNFVEMPASNLDEVKAAVGWLLVALPIMLPSSVLQGALQSRLRFGTLNIIQVVGITAAQVIPLFVAVSGYVSLQALVPAALSSRLIVIALLMGSCRRAVPLRGAPVFSWGHFSALAKYGGWMSVIGLLGPLLVTIDRVLIASIGGAKAVAHYTVPYDLVARAMVLSSSFSSALFPKLASASRDDGLEMAQAATSSLMMVMTPLVIFGLFIVQPFIVFWIDDSFADQSRGVAEVVLLGIWINCLAVPFNTYLLGSGRPKEVAISYAVQVPLYLLLLWHGLHQFGVVGAAFAWTGRVLMDTLIMLALTGRVSTTLISALPPFVLVLASTITTTVLSPTIPARVAVLFLLLMAALALYWKQYLHMARQLVARQVDA
jgi:O-antigen/teichoic acid export membrane protein